MANDEPLKIEVRYSKQFKRDLKRLEKHYSHIKNDIKPELEKLESGEILGDRLQGSGYRVYKLRVRNTDIQKGKSAGYRIIYYTKLEDLIVLITMYSKSERSDVTAEEIIDIIEQLEDDE